MKKVLIYKIHILIYFLYGKFNIWKFFFKFNPIPYGLRPTPIPYGGGDNIAPLSKIPENGRLGLNLWIYTKCGLKFQKNPNQFHMNS